MQRCWSLNGYFHFWTKKLWQDAAHAAGVARTIGLIENAQIVMSKTPGEKKKFFYNRFWQISRYILYNSEYVSSA